MATSVLPYVIYVHDSLLFYNQKAFNTFLPLNVKYNYSTIETYFHEIFSYTHAIKEHCKLIWYFVIYHIDIHVS